MSWLESATRHLQAGALKASAGCRDAHHGRAAMRRQRDVLQLSLPAMPHAHCTAHLHRPRHALLPIVVWWLGLIACASVHAQAEAPPPQATPSTEAREAFRACDAQAFLALSMARNYLMTGRNRELVRPHVQGNPLGEAMAEEMYSKGETGQLGHPGQFAADVLFRCAAETKLRVGASRPRVATCFTRTDVAFFMHAERERGVVRQQAVSNVLKRLTVRELYPTALVNSVAEAVYKPAKLPDLQRLMGALAWTCINQPPAAASAASR